MESENKFGTTGRMAGIALNSVLLDRNRERVIVFYGRVSSEHEAQLSALENQLQWYDDQAKYHPNWKVLRKYIDKGITGTQAKKRPSFMQMIEDAKQKKFDLIVTREVCRFARNTVDTLVVTRELKKYGVEVYFVEDNIWTMDGDGELRLTIMATLAQEESRKTSERVLVRQKISRDNGVLYGSGNILGYDRVGGTYVINEEQAETVRMIFDMYLKGMGTMKICHELLRLRRKDASGLVRWECTKVTRILHNATYKGYQGYLKSHRNNYLEQKPIANHDESTYLYVKGNFEPIVSEEVWDECKRIRESRVSNRKVKSTGETIVGGFQPTKDLWARKLICRCGYRFRKDKWHRNKSGLTYGYKCYNQLNRGNKQARVDAGLPADDYCDVGCVADWKLDMMFAAVLRTLKKVKNDVIRHAYKIFNENCKRDFSIIDRQIGEMEGMIAKEKKKLDNLTDMRMNDEVSKDEFLSHKERICSNMLKLELRLNDLRGKLMEEDKEVLPKMTYDQFEAMVELSVDFTKPIMQSSVAEQLVEKILVNTEHEFTWYLNIFPHDDEEHREYKEAAELKIEFDEAREFRAQRGAMLRRNQWWDLTVHLMI